MSRRVRGFYVTGTDTGVGKSEIACALVRAFEHAGISAVGMKPVAAGARKAGRVLINADVEALDHASSVRAPRALRNPYVFAPPIAPHLAAEEAGVELDIDVMLEACRKLGARADIVIVEGAGGFLVPLDARRDMGELARRLRLPVIMVVGMRLGCISHALLTAEAIEARGLRLAGWVANRIDPRMRRYRGNVAALATRLSAPLLADMPHVEGAATRRRTMVERLAACALLRRLPSNTTT